MLEQSLKGVVAQFSLSHHHSAHGRTIWFPAPAAYTDTIDRKHESCVKLYSWQSL